jgi:hypothetical protein
VQFHFMKTVAWCFVAGLSLAALARLGGAVAKSSPRKTGARCRCRERGAVDFDLTEITGLKLAAGTGGDKAVGKRTQRLVEVELYGPADGRN